MGRKAKVWGTRLGAGGKRSSLQPLSGNGSSRAALFKLSFLRRPGVVNPNLAFQVFIKIALSR